jgi:hypothetical protein
MIRSETNRLLDLTINTCTGKLSLEEIEDRIQSFYKGQPTLNTIWDFSDADLADFSTDQVSIFAQGVKRMEHSRQRGKTAIISHSDISYGLSRMYQIRAELAQQQSEIRVFKSIGDAESWMGIKGST